MVGSRACTDGSKPQTPSSRGLGLHVYLALNNEQCRLWLRCWQERDLEGAQTSNGVLEGKPSGLPRHDRSEGEEEMMSHTGQR